MSKITIDLSDVEGIAELLRDAPKDALDAAHEAAKLVGRQVLTKAKAAAPRDRPWLATSGIRLKTWRDANGSHADIFTVPDDRNRPVGFFVEYGTTDTPPQPFLGPQMTWAPDEFASSIVDKLDPLA